MIVAVHRAALDQVHGPGSWLALRDELSRYLLALQAHGVPSSAVYLDRPPDSGVAAAPAGIGDAGAAVRIVRAAMAQAPAARAVLLVGGDAVIPSVRLPKEATLAGDTDTAVPSDNPYGTSVDTAAAYLAPTLAVGRIAAGPKDSVDVLVAQLRRAREWRSSGHTTAGALVLTNRAWAGASAAVAARMPLVPVSYTSPAYEVTSPADLRRRHLLFNLHGERMQPAWFGRNEQGASWRALAPAVVLLAEPTRATVFACNCYGMDPGAASVSQSVALAFMNRGAACVIAATGYAFGAIQFLVEYAEELAFRFFTLLPAEASAGLALARARREYASARAASSALARKTAQQFVFLGDPLL